MAKETISAKGTVFLQVWNAKGELIEEITHNNLVVNTGRQALAQLLGSANSDMRVNTIGFAIVLLFFEFDAFRRSVSDTSTARVFLFTLKFIGYSSTYPV